MSTVDSVYVLTAVSEDVAALYLMDTSVEACCTTGTIAFGHVRKGTPVETIEAGPLVSLLVLRRVFEPRSLLVVEAVVVRLCAPIALQDNLIKAAIHMASYLGFDRMAARVDLSSCPDWALRSDGAIVSVDLPDILAYPDDEDKTTVFRRGGTANDG